MNKEKVIAIALIILVTLIVSIIVIVKDRTSNEELDTSLFNVKSISEVNELMKENKSYFIYIGRKDCSACKSFEPTIQYAMVDQNFPVMYIEINDIDVESEDFKTFTEVLSAYNYEYDGETKTFDKYLGMTPMIFISRNNEIIYGHLGKMSTEEIKTIAKEMELSYE
ncbi:MAG: hypothetical protein ACI4WW_02315 [Candidatus Coprovivens sp.]